MVPWSPWENGNAGNLTHFTHRFTLSPGAVRNCSYAKDSGQVLLDNRLYRDDTRFIEARVRAMSLTCIIVVCITGGVGLVPLALFCFNLKLVCSPDR